MAKEKGGFMREPCKCPLCGKEDERVLLRPHWSKKYHEFICGHCKIELAFKRDERDIDIQLKDALDQWLIKATGESMEAMVNRMINTMTEEEMLERLDELNATCH